MFFCEFFNGILCFTERSQILYFTKSLIKILLLLKFKIFNYISLNKIRISLMQNRIMVSLTSLLVLSALFVQTSYITPKTAYLKLIDVWYTVLIILDFTVIWNLVVIENARLFVQHKSIFNSHSLVATTIDVLTKEGMNDNMPYRRARKYNRICLFAIPTMYFIFLAVIAGLAQKKFFSD